MDWCAVSPATVGRQIAWYMRGRYKQMSNKTLENIMELCDSVDRNRAVVEERMRNAGIPADPLVSNSIAKYWQAMEKLAAE